MKFGKHPCLFAWCQISFNSKNFLLQQTKTPNVKLCLQKSIAFWYNIQMLNFNQFEIKYQTNYTKKPYVYF